MYVHTQGSVLSLAEASSLSSLSSTHYIYMCNPGISYQKPLYNVFHLITVILTCYSPLSPELAVFPYPEMLVAPGQ